MTKKMNKISNITTDLKNPKQGSIRDGFGKALAQISRDNDKIIGLCADLTHSTKMNYFAQLFPDRFFHMGVAEQNMAGVAAGLAMEGKIPISASYAIFQPGRNWEQIRQNICYSNLNVKLVSTHAGITVGPDGASHQALEDLSLTRVLPNMTVISPCDEYQATQATYAMIEHQGPVYLRLSRIKSPQITTPQTTFKLGKGQIFHQGNDLTIISTGTMIYPSLQAAKILEKNNISTQVINIHTIKPIDEQLIISAAKQTGAVITVEDHQKIGGLGSAVAQVLTEHHPTKMKIIGVDDTFGQSGQAHELLEYYGLGVEDIVRAGIELTNN